MSAHHKTCDEMFAKAEQAVADNNWDTGLTLWKDFADELLKHFKREEDILFPDFEQVTGMAGGPTQMMRMEHEQMRILLNEIDKAGAAKDQDQFMGLTETLMITMQQHNMKEEQILYPMMDQSLPDIEKMVEKISHVE
jgi:iron-sulfur cluster repair protein YtfE (RIC family)